MAGSAGLFLGTSQGGADEGWKISTIAGTGSPGHSGDQGPATEAQLNNPFGIAQGPDGALYVCEFDGQVVRRIDNAGRITTTVGSGRQGSGGDGGPALQAELNQPHEIRFDRDGSLYIADMQNHRVRRVDAGTQRITTVAGTGEPGFSGDGGPAIRARLRQPHSIQLDSQGALYICDIGNHRIRRVDPRTGVISTLAGTGETGQTPDGAAFASTPLNGPRSIDFDAEGGLWVVLREGNQVFRLNLAQGTIHHVAGTGKKGFSGNGGPAALATLSGPKGLAVGPDGNVYLADTESHSLRMIDVRRKTLELIAGTGEKGNGPEGDPKKCLLGRPHGVFVDRDGAIFIGDSENHRVRVIRRSGSTP